MPLKECSHNKKRPLTKTPQIPELLFVNHFGEMEKVNLTSEAIVLILCIDGAHGDHVRLVGVDGPVGRGALYRWMADVHGRVVATPYRW